MATSCHNSVIPSPIESNNMKYICLTILYCAVFTCSEASPVPTVTRGTSSKVTTERENRQVKSDNADAQADAKPMGPQFMGRQAQLLPGQLLPGQQMPGQQSPFGFGQAQPGRYANNAIIFSGAYPNMGLQGVGMTTPGFNFGATPTLGNYISGTVPTDLYGGNFMFNNGFLPNAALGASQNLDNLVHVANYQGILGGATQLNPLQFQAQASQLQPQAIPPYPLVFTGFQGYNPAFQTYQQSL